MTSKATITQCVSKQAYREVIGCYILNPELVKTHKLVKEDFTENFYFIIYTAIAKLINQEVKIISVETIEQLLNEKDYPIQHADYVKNNGSEYLLRAIKLAQEENFNYYYTLVKKYSLLRSFLKAGISIDEYFNPNDMEPEIIEEKRNRLESDSIQEIIKTYRSKVIEIASSFDPTSGRDSMKAGVGGMEQKEIWKQNIAYGLSYPSQILTQVTSGIKQKRFTVMSAGTGVGKTRISIANLCHSFVPRFYNSKTKQWQQNPNGTKNGALYIGTEMELLEEINPILWAYIADVPQEHIMYNLYEEGEEERVDRAIQILENEANIWLEYVPDYDINTLERVIDEHVNKHNIKHVFFDYIHTTVDLISEYSTQAKAKMNLREDQILANLSNKLKEMCRKYDVSINTWTQVSGDYKNEQNRDSSIVRGAKAIIDKCDIAAIVSLPTVKELKILEPITKTLLPKTRGDKVISNVPNVCMSVYKNRGGKYNKVKIWLYIDYNTMRVHDLFVTDNSYKRNTRDVDGLVGKYLYINEDNALALSDIAPVAEYNNEFSNTSLGEEREEVY